MGSRDTEEKKAARIDMMWREALSVPSARFVLHSILEGTGVFADIAGDTAQVNYLLGKRSVGITLRQDILTSDPEALKLMEDEYNAFHQHFETFEDGEDEDG